MKLQLKKGNDYYTLPAPETETPQKLLDWAHDMAVIYAEALDAHSTEFEGKFILEPYELNRIKKHALSGEIEFNKPNSNIAQIIEFEYYPRFDKGEIVASALIKNYDLKTCGIMYKCKIKDKELFTKLYALGTLSDNWKINILYA